MALVRFREIDIRFAPNQKLPKHYKVQWWEQDEHYHWVIEGTFIYSDCFATRWQAYRSAHVHAKGFNLANYLKARGLVSITPEAYEQEGYSGKRLR